MFTKSTDIPFESISPVPHKYTKVFKVDRRRVELNIWDASGVKDVDVKSLDQKLCPSIVSQMTTY